MLSHFFPADLFLADLLLADLPSTFCSFRSAAWYLRRMSAMRPASFRKLRGPTYVAVIADELAFWYADVAYANPDIEILTAVEPGLATTGCTI